MRFVVTLLAFLIIPSTYAQTVCDTQKDALKSNTEYFQYARTEHLQSLENVNNNLKKLDLNGIDEKLDIFKNQTNSLINELIKLQKIACNQTELEMIESYKSLKAQLKLIRTTVSDIKQIVNEELSTL